MVVSAIVVLLVGWWLSRMLTGLTCRVMARAEVDSMLTTFVCNLTYVALMALVVISALGELGINTAAFAAIIAAGGLAVGFALQGSLGNFAAGVMLMLFRPRLGDQGPRGPSRSSRPLMFALPSVKQLGSHALGVRPRD